MVNQIYFNIFRKQIFPYLNRFERNVNIWFQDWWWMQNIWSRSSFYHMFAINLKSEWGKFASEWTSKWNWFIQKGKKKNSKNGLSPSEERQFKKSRQVTRKNWIFPLNTKSSIEEVNVPVPSENLTPPINSLLANRSWSHMVSSNARSDNSSNDTSS